MRLVNTATCGGQRVARPPASALEVISSASTGTLALTARSTTALNSSVGVAPCTRWPSTKPPSVVSRALGAPLAATIEATMVVVVVFPLVPVTATVWRRRQMGGTELAFTISARVRAPRAQHPNAS